MPASAPGSVSTSITLGTYWSRSFWRHPGLTAWSWKGVMIGCGKTHNSPEPAMTLPISTSDSMTTSSEDVNRHRPPSSLSSGLTASRASIRSPKA